MVILDTPCAYILLASPSENWARRQMRTCEESSLAKVPLLNGLSDSARLTLEDKCEWASFDPGELVVDYLAVDDSVYFLISGFASVKIYSEAGKVVAFRTIEQGDVFGELAALDGRPRSANVEAVETSRIAKLGAAHFRNLLAEETAFAAKVCVHLTKQVRDLTARIYEFSTLAVQNRIHAELLRLVRENVEEHGTSCIIPAPRHADLASRISTHREAVSRELSRLSKIGVVTKQDGNLHVNDIQQLEAMVREATKE